MAHWLERLFVAPILLYRRARYGYAFRRIPLTGPRYAKVDPDDYERLRKYEWSAMQRGHLFYAARFIKENKQSKWRLVNMHREIIKITDGMVADHTNQDTMDNRKANIRQATHAQNMANRKKLRIPTTSRYKGVCFRKDSKKWGARIAVNGNRKSLGHFTDEIDAAKAYDNAARKYHGQFAYLNFPDPENPQPQIRLRLWALLCSLIRLIKDLSRLLLARP